MPSNDKKRIFEYDLMKVIFMLMVLATHTLNVVNNFSSPYNTTWTVKRILVDFFMVCNPLFFMLSGKFNLNKNFKESKDYKNFYYKKLISIILPFLIVSAIIYARYHFHSLSIKKFISLLLLNKIEATFWFVYVLVGILVFSPFFSKMLKNMNLFEKKLFLLLSFIMNAFVTILALFKIKSIFTLSIFGIISWHIYYFVGYIIEDVFQTKKSRIFIMIGAIISFVLQFLIRRFMDYGYRLTDPFPLLTIETFGVYFFILEFIHIKNLKLQNIISYISKYSYIFYLLHMFVFVHIVKYFNLTISSLHNWLLLIPIFLITFLVTQLLAILLNKIILTPLQNLLIHILNKKISTSN